MTSPERVLPQEIRIDGQGLVNIIQSDKFRRKVQTLSRKLRQSEDEYELGFVAMRGLDNQDFTLVSLTNTAHSSISLGESGLKVYKRCLTKRQFPIISLHFHPPLPKLGTYNFSNYIPSRDDLECQRFIYRDDIREEFGYDGFPLGIVAIAKGSSLTEMILYQETPFSITSQETLKEYEEDVSLCKTKKEIIQTLQDYAYKSAFINYTQKGLTTEGQKIIQSLGFNLKPVINDAYGSA